MERARAFDKQTALMSDQPDRDTGPRWSNSGARLVHQGVCPQRKVVSVPAMTTRYKGP